MINWIMKGAKEAPTRRSRHAAGYDLCCLESFNLSSSTGPVSVKTGVGVKCPAGYYGQVLCKSGFGKKGMIVHAGVIDADYRGEIIVIVSTVGDECITVEAGKPFAQILFLPVLSAPLEDETERGDAGFGEMTGRS